jgi:hypothetical protein
MSTVLPATIALNNKQKINFFIKEDFSLEAVQYCGIPLTNNEVYLNPQLLKELLEISPVSLQRFKYDCIEQTEENRAALEKYDTLIEQLEEYEHELETATTQERPELLDNCKTIKKSMQQLENDTLNPAYIKAEKADLYSQSRNKTLMMSSTLTGLVCDITQSLQEQVKDSSNKEKLEMAMRKAQIIHPQDKRLIPAKEFVANEFPNLMDGIDDISILISNTLMNASQSTKEYFNESKNVFLQPPKAISKEQAAISRDIEKEYKEYQTEKPTVK